MNNKPQNETENLKSQTRTAVEHGENIKHQVRDITIQALSQGDLDIDKIKLVLRGVIQGARDGVGERADESKILLGEAVHGLDEALSKSVQASQLAIEEAAGHIKDFGKQDLSRAINDLMALEALFIEVLKNVAKESDDVIKRTLNDLAEHARNSGTVAGKTASSTAESLNQKLGKSLQDSVSIGKDAALSIAANVSKAAAGFLDGIAQSLQPKDKSSKNKPK